jgi:hypothetical protein
MPWHTTRIATTTRARLSSGFLDAAADRVIENRAEEREAERVGGDDVHPNLRDLGRWRQAPTGHGYDVVMQRPLR